MYAARTMVRMWWPATGATSAGVGKRSLAAAASSSCIISERVHAGRHRCGVEVSHTRCQHTRFVPPGFRKFQLSIAVGPGGLTGQKWITCFRS